MTMNQKQIELLPHQSEFLKAKDKFVLLLGGIGSGKSVAGSLFAILESQQEKNVPGLITANTYRQLQNATLNTLFNICDEHNIDYDYNQHKGILNLCGAKWFTYSLDSYDNMRGIEVGKFWGDEMRDASYQAFLVMLGRLRFGTNLKGRLTTSPSGFDYLHEHFVGDKKTTEFRLIHATSMSNKFLPKGYIDTLEKSYDNKMFAQEVLGEFINTTSGRIYHAFNRDNNLSFDAVLNPKYPIYVGMDFNVNPMTAVLCQSYSDCVYVFDEIYLNDSNTPSMCSTLKSRYGNNITVVPDSTGSKRSTSAPIGKSDIQILIDAGFQVKTSGNPMRIDRYNTVNNLLEKNRIKINPKCVKMIRDLEQVSYKEGTNLPATNDSTLTHISDALGYFCWFAFPILPNKTEVRMMAR
jgi:PBSX family phage terminase large subunit